MSDKILPTRTTAIAVRPESIPTPEGKTERRELRTTHGKTFLHAEEAPDGKELRTCHVQMGAVCYRDDTGELRSIDTTIRDLGGEIGVEWAPYLFRLHSTGVGFDFTSREGGQVSIKLTGIGREAFDQDATLKPDITDNIITFRDVRPGCDIVFKCLNDRVKTLRILHDDNAPKTFEWRCESDRPELIDSTLTGTDATGKSLDLTATIDGDVITETWAGGDVAYPVEIDPTVNASISDDADDGYQYNSTWYSNDGNIVFANSYFGAVCRLGFRFTGITVPQASTVTVATHTAYAKSVGSGGAAGGIWGQDVDNSSVFDSGNLPADIVKTTASTAVATVSSTGEKSYTVTSIIQEIVDRAGWSSGNSLNLAWLPTSGGYTTFQDRHDGTSNVATLSITYTAGGGGGTSQNLLLLGCG